MGGGGGSISRQGAGEERQQFHHVCSPDCFKAACINERRQGINRGWYETRVVCVSFYEGP